MSAEGLLPLLVLVCLGWVSAQRTITIDGGWSPWSTIATPCQRENQEGIMVPVTCGGGKMTRKRSCTNPVPQVNEKTFIVILDLEHMLQDDG